MTECSNCLESSVELYDVIQEWRVVKMCKFCAKEEGVTVLNPKAAEEKKAHYLDLSKEHNNKIVQKEVKIERLGKSSANNVIKDLIENFHWNVSQARKSKNLTRKQLASQIQESEETIKQIELGVLPRDDFIIISKIQSALGINLRKDGQTFKAPQVHSFPAPSSHQIRSQQSANSAQQPQSRSQFLPRSHLNEKSKNPDIKELKDALSGAEIEIIE